MYGKSKLFTSFCDMSAGVIGSPDLAYTSGAAFHGCTKVAFGGFAFAFAFAVAGFFFATVDGGCGIVAASAGFAFATSSGFAFGDVWFHN